MRKAFQRRHGLAALSVFVGLLMAGGAAADRIKMLFPEPPMIGDPDIPNGSPMLVITMIGPRPVVALVLRERKRHHVEPEARIDRVEHQKESGRQR